jgi:hypothetical protein
MAIACAWFSIFLMNPFVSHVNLRMLIWHPTRFRPFFNYDKVIDSFFAETRRQFHRPRSLHAQGFVVAIDCNPAVNPAWNLITRVPIISVEVQRVYRRRILRRVDGSASAAAGWPKTALPTRGKRSSTMDHRPSHDFYQNFPSRGSFLGVDLLVDGAYAVSANNFVVWSR